MENRQPTYPGRVKLTPVPGSSDLYDMERADQPTVEGTPLNKETLLQDATCAILDIPDTSVPNDAFVKLALGIGKYGYVIHVQYPDGTPAEGFTLTGLNAPDGTPAVTNEDGDAVGVSTGQSVSVGINSPYIDVDNIQSVLIESTGILTNYVFTVTFNDEEYIPLETSNTYKYSPKVISYDVTAVGGGASASTYPPDNGYGSGGGGGYVDTALNVTPQENREITVTVGAGGQWSVYSASSGGVTSVQENGQSIVSANGGSPGTVSGETAIGGAGNGKGGDSFESGQDATGFIFNDSTLGLAGGGGGAGMKSRSGAAGGLPYGGASRGIGVSSESGKGPGGGGAGGQTSGGSTSTPGSGHSGAVYFRAHYTAA